MELLVAAEPEVALREVELPGRDVAGMFSEVVLGRSPLEALLAEFPRLGRLRIAFSKALAWVGLVLGASGFTPLLKFAGLVDESPEVFARPAVGIPMLDVLSETLLLNKVRGVNKGLV